MQYFDVVVVGGGPAGAVSALKCSQLGFDTLLVEWGAPDRHKPCGGILPPLCIDILDDLGLEIPTSTICAPPTIGLFYVPPSGRRNSGYVRNYQLLNMNRDRFDEWLPRLPAGRDEISHRRREAIDRASPDSKLETTGLVSGGTFFQK